MRIYPAVRRAVWRQHDFAFLLAGQTVSEVGSQVTVLALPTLVIFDFHSGPATVGLLVAAERLPFPVLSLFAGAVIDRVRKRPVMIGCNLARLLILGAVPLLAALGLLRLWEVFVAAVSMGVFTVFFDIAYLALVPALVTPGQLVEANSRLEITFSAASLAGPGIGGLLVQAVGAARAVAADSASFLVSALTLAAIRHRETRPAPAARTGMMREVGEGLRHVFGSPVLRAQLLCMSAAGVFAHAYEAPLFIFAYDRLHLSPGLLGAILTCEGVGSLIGGAVATRFIAAAGVGRAIAVADGAAIAMAAFIPLAAFLAAPAALLFPLFALTGLLGTVGNIAQVTLRQSLSPPRLQGRMTSVFRTFFWGAWPLGNLLGGLLAGVLGAATTLVLMGGVGALVNMSIVFTPLWKVRDFGSGATGLDTPLEAPAGEVAL